LWSPIYQRQSSSSIIIAKKKKHFHYSSRPAVFVPLTAVIAFLFYFLPYIYSVILYREVSKKPKKKYGDKTHFTRWIYCSSLEICLKKLLVKSTPTDWLTAPGISRLLKYNRYVWLFFYSFFFIFSILFSRGNHAVSRLSTCALDLRRFVLFFCV